MRDGWSEPAKRKSPGLREFTSVSVRGRHVWSAKNEKGRNKYTDGRFNPLSL